jgi:hypothetical protein
MATSSTIAWAKGFSDNPAGKTLRAKSIIEMLDHIGGEKGRAPGAWGDDMARPYPPPVRRPCSIRNQQSAICSGRVRLPRLSNTCAFPYKPL